VPKNLKSPIRRWIGHLTNRIAAALRHDLNDAGGHRPPDDGVAEISIRIASLHPGLSALPRLWLDKRPNSGTALPDVTQLLLR
jgi:hypothetical protein